MKKTHEGRKMMTDSRCVEPGTLMVSDLRPSARVEAWTFCIICLPVPYFKCQVLCPACFVLGVFLGASVFLIGLNS